MIQKFEFTKDNLKKVKQEILKYPESRQQSAVLFCLDIAQRQNNGWISQPIIEYVAKTLNMSYIKVHEVASFYSMFNLKPVGKYHIQICGTTPCWLRGAADLRKTAEEFSGVECGAISEDGNFTISEVECLGGCVNAPIVQINDDYYEDLEPEDLKNIMTEFKNGKTPKAGSYKNRQCSAPQDS